MSTYLNINAIKDGSIPDSKLEENYIIQEEGKQLSTNDFTDTLKSKLESLYNYDDTDIQNSIQLLSDKLEILFGESGTDAIETFNEIIKFLENIDDSESLDSIIKSIEQQITQKQDTISDLSTIRSNASKGAVAEQNAKNYTNAEINKLTPSVIVNDNTIAVQVGSKQSEEVIVPYAKFANDLTGHIEATYEEFSYRPSAGQKSIKDDSAIIKSIKGNTIIWNQLFKSPKLDGTYSISANTTDEGIVNGMRRIVSTDGTATTIRIQDMFSPATIKGHKYYIADTINTDGNAVSWTFNGALPEPQVASTPSVKKRYDMISTAVHSLNTVLQVRVHNATFMEATNQIFIDLTQMFGAGNEPSTVEEFRALFPNEYYEYNAGEFRSLSADGIKTTGFNQWDEEWELGVYSESLGTKQPATNTICNVNRIEVFPNTVYNIKHPKAVNLLAYIYFYDFDGNYINRKYVNSNTFTTPENCGYINFFMTSVYGVRYNNDICINLSHTGYRNGEYEPYKEFIRELDVIKKYFPDGMKSAGTVYDEITSTKAITRIGVVDLGELSWEISPDGTLLFSTTLGVEINGKRGINVFCQKYDAYSYDNAVTKDKTISLQVGYTQSGKTSVMVRDSAYTDAASFKTAMSGVMLYYELAEPIEVEFDEVVDLTYNVYDFGTEQIISSVPTTPFRGDIVYQFNATDTIRQNKNNISKIVSKVHEIDNALTSKQDKLTVETLDNGNIKVEGLGEFMAATPSGDPSHTLYEAVGAVWNATTGYWEFNGILNMTNADMAATLTYGNMTNNNQFAYGQYYKAPFRTNIWARRLYSTPTISLTYMFRNSNKLEVLDLAGANKNASINVSGVSAAFYQCTALRRIIGVLRLKDDISSLAYIFDFCANLEEVYIGNLKRSLNISAASKFKKECLLYMIQNAAPTSAITITVHADVYTWASTDAEIQEALTAQPLVTIISA